jgi:hypothetical protein
LFSPQRWGICEWGIVLFSRKANAKKTYAGQLWAPCVKLVENKWGTPVTIGVAAWRNRNG